MVKRVPTSKLGKPSSLKSKGVGSSFLMGKRKRKQQKEPEFDQVKTPQGSTTYRK